MRVLSGDLLTASGEYLFKGLELCLYPSGWTCLLGTSGVGKTTVLRLLANLDVHGTFSGFLKELDVAYMAQQDLLMPWLDVLGNVVLGASLRGEIADVDRAKKLIENVGLGDDVNKFPGQLSGGMRQRAALARTLMEDREVVLLDEPFCALDAQMRSEMQELSHGLLRGKTVLLVTHDPLEAARLGDRIVIMNQAGLAEAISKEEEAIPPVDATETLMRQSRLLNMLRRTAS